MPARARSRLRGVSTGVAIARRTVTVPVLYLSVLTVAAWWVTLRRRRPAPAQPHETRFALLVPAHDEELLIGETLRAMSQLVYPAELFEVHVVADHCVDKTVEIARQAGVVVHEHAGDHRGKGPALQWAIRRVLDGHPAPDVIVIVDADTIVGREALAAMDRRFAAGALVVQGQYRVREPGGSTGAGLRAAALALRHHLRPLGRTTLGASCGLYGNGMAFRSSVLAEHRWTDHLTEDLELQAELLLAGVLVAYEPNAVVEAEMPDTLAGARTQNERWERGRLDVARRYVPPLARLAIHDRGRRVAALDGVLDQLVPPLSVLVAATGGVAVAGSAVDLLGGRGGGRAGWLLVVALAGHVVSGLVLAKVPWSVYRSLPGAPAMAWWKLRLWMRMLVRPGVEGWARTARVGR